MLRNYVGIINLDENPKDIRALTTHRNIGSIPIAGRYRIIDFPLSNMVNAGINHICVFADNPTRSLSDHLSNGKPWELDRKIGGLYVINNSLTGDIFDSGKAIFENNSQLLNKITEEYVIISSSYMICNIDLEEIAEYHEKNQCDITAVYKTVEIKENEFMNCNTFNVDKNKKIYGAARNFGKNEKVNICMEMFIMKKALLSDLLFKIAQEGTNVKLKDYICAHISEYNIIGYEFKGYLICINTVDSYYHANMDMLEISTMGALFSKSRPVYTKTKDSPPVKYSKESEVKHSLVADGTIIKGKVKNSIIFRSVTVEEGAEIEGCIILQKAYIGKNAKLKNVIVDKGVEIGEGVDIKCPQNHPLTLERKMKLK